MLLLLLFAPHPTPLHTTHTQGGDEIIDALCKHSTTFEAKTEFAQDKYKRRKARKYLTRLTLRQPTGWTVCQVRGRVCMCVGFIARGGGGLGCVWGAGVTNRLWCAVHVCNTH